MSLKYLQVFTPVLCVSPPGRGVCDIKAFGLDESNLPISLGFRAFFKQFFPVLRS